MARTHVLTSILTAGSDGVLRALAGAQVAVYQSGTGSASGDTTSGTPLVHTLYAGPTGSATISNPFTVGDNAEVDFWLDVEVEMDLGISKSGYGAQIVREAAVSSAIFTAHTHADAAEGGQVAHTALLAIGADDHHAKSHAHDGADGSGTVAHSALTGKTANDHHNQAHSLTGADHTLAGLTVGDVLTATGPTAAAFQTPAAQKSLINQLVNGGMEIWQRGNGPFTSVSAITADGWAISINGTDTLSVSKDTANVDTGSAACAALTYVKGTGTFAQHLRSLWYKPVEFPQLFGTTVTISARVKCATPNAVRVSLDDYYSASDHLVYSGYHTGGGGYETLTATVTTHATATFLIPGISFSASATAYVDNVSLVISATPVDYVQLPPSEDLARCQRYYEILYPEVTIVATAAGQNCLSSVHYSVAKGGTPTLTRNGTWTVTNCGQPAVGVRAGAERSDFYIYATSAAAGAMGFYPASAATNVTAEWNP